MIKINCLQNFDEFESICFFNILKHADQSVCTGKNFIDDEVLASMDIDVEQYRVDPNIKEKDLMPDFFC